MILAIKFTTQNIIISEQSNEGRNVKVKRIIRGDMPEGAYQKGVIINTAEVAGRIAELIKANGIKTKRVATCMNGPDIIKKEFQIPEGTEKQMRGILENEMKKTDLLKNEYLFDFCYDKEKKKSKEEENLKTVTAYLVPRQLVQNYVQTIQRAGLVPIKIQPMNDNMDKLLKLLSLRGQSKLSILAYVQTNSIDLVMTGKGIKDIYRNIPVGEDDLFVDNMFVLSSKQNIGNSKDPEEKLQEKLVENVSKLVQFQSQRDRDSQVEAIYIYGDIAKNTVFLKNVEEASGINVKQCTIAKEFLKINPNHEIIGHEDIIALSASKFVREEKELGFVKQYMEQKSGHMTAKDKIPVYVMFGLVVVMLFTSVGAVILRTLSDKRVQTTEAQIEEIITSQQYTDNLITTELIAQYAKYNNLVNRYIKTLEETKRLEAEMITQLEQLCPIDVSILSYGYEAGQLTVTCRAANQEGPAAYAQNATESEKFTNVEYTGFQLDSDIEGNEFYRFILKCGVE